MPNQLARFTQLQSCDFSMSQLGHNPQDYNPLNYHTTPLGVISLAINNNRVLELSMPILEAQSQRRIQGGGLLGLIPPPGPVKSIDFRGFSCPNKCWQPPSKEKNLSPPGQILEYAPAQSSSPLFRTRTRLLSHRNQYGVSIPTSVFMLSMLQEKVNRRI